jgi:hypothetical protein
LHLSIFDPLQEFSFFLPLIFNFRFEYNGLRMVSVCWAQLLSNNLLFTLLFLFDYRNVNTTALTSHQFPFHNCIGHNNSRCILDNHILHLHDSLYVH